MRCHCMDCRKWTGSMFSNNLIVPLSGFKVLQGKLRTYTMEAASGHHITNYFSRRLRIHLISPDDSGDGCGCGNDRLH